MAPPPVFRGNMTSSRSRYPDPLASMGNVTRTTNPIEDGPPSFHGGREGHNVESENRGSTTAATPSHTKRPQYKIFTPA